MRSAGLITSVRRMPNFSFTTTTSPWATNVPLTKTSSGSPAARPSPTTEPWFNCRRLRMGMRVRPTSMDKVTGTSRMTSRLTSPEAAWPSSFRLSNSAALAFMTSIPLAGRPVGGGEFEPADLFFDLHGLLATGQTERAAEDRNLLREQRDFAGKVAGQDVARLHVQQLGKADGGFSQQGGELDVGVLDLLAQAHRPALVLLDPVARDARIQNFAQRLDHRVRHGDVQVAAAAIQLDMEARLHHDLRRRDDVREVRVDFGIQILDLDRGDMRPRLVKVGKHVSEQHVNDSLLGGGELPAFDLCVPAGAAKEIVDHSKHELRIEHDERRAAKGMDFHKVQARRNVQGVHVFAELLDVDRIDRYFR